MEERTEFTAAEKKRMLLSDETLLGLRMTGFCCITQIIYMYLLLSFFCTVNSFLHLVRYLFLLPEVKGKNLSFLSFTLCKDPLEGFLDVKGNVAEHVTIPVSWSFTKTQLLFELSTHFVDIQH